MSSTHEFSETETTESEAESFVEEHRDKIEREANSDAPDAWVFQRLLESSEGESA